MHSYGAVTSDTMHPIAQKIGEMRRLQDKFCKRGWFSFFVATFVMLDALLVLLVWQHRDRRNFYKIIVLCAIKVQIF